MPSGHASHKSTSNKPNTNASGQIDNAADLSVNPEAEVESNADALRASEAPADAAATERPATKQEDQ